MADFFKTISLPVDGIYKEKGSKFLAFAYPVKSKNEIEVIIQNIKKDYADARHICFAWMLGAERLDFKGSFEVCFLT
jgi:putative IMPACT (imprinted ancient) family translation regulator